MGVTEEWSGRGLAMALLAALALTLLLALPSPATAAEKSFTVETKGPGPAEFDVSEVHSFGPKNPKQVLVLMPGTAGGAGDFTLVARDLVDRVPGLAVWSLDRRSQVLEDTSVFEQALAGEATLQEMFDYYLGWITNGGTPADHFQFLDPETVPFARNWGMKVALQDARKVVREAKRTGAEVLLGGHSLGASLAAAYAAWDFKGKAGFEGLGGIVLIDGGLLGSFDAYTEEEAAAQLETLDEEPFLDLIGVGIPEASGLFAETGGVFAKLAPTADAGALQDYPLLPEDFKPPVPATTRALLGYAFDRDTSPDSLSLLHVNGGGLAAAGEPRDWVDGGITPVANIAETFGQEPANAVEWYFPRRLTIDTNGANAMRQNGVADLLGLRLEHTDEIDIPIYAFQTDLTDGGVLRGANNLLDRAKTKRSESMLVEGAPQASHLDPLTASTKKNEFLSTVSRFIEKKTR
jgi:pimeloyl-ACP methyl ester carboxylesterase